jgi:hypothetical protein
MKAEFIIALSVTELTAGAWQINPPRFGIVIYDGDRKIFICIEPGFITDFCSVPRIPFAYLLYGNLANKAGVGHDALYSDWPNIFVVDLDTGEPFKYDRAWADNALSAMLKECGVGAFKRGMMYAGVRAFGWKYYKKS